MHLLYTAYSQGRCMVVYFLLSILYQWSTLAIESQGPYLILIFNCVGWKPWFLIINAFGLEDFLLTCWRTSGYLLLYEGPQCIWVPLLHLIQCCLAQRACYFKMCNIVNSAPIRQHQVFNANVVLAIVPALHICRQFLKLSNNPFSSLDDKSSSSSLHTLVLSMNLSKLATGSKHWTSKTSFTRPKSGL